MTRPPSTKRTTGVFDPRTGAFGVELHSGTNATHRTSTVATPEPTGRAMRKTTRESPRDDTATTGTDPTNAANGAEVLG